MAKSPQHVFCALFAAVLLLFGIYQLVVWGVDRHSGAADERQAKIAVFNQAVWEWQNQHRQHFANLAATIVIHEDNTTTSFRLNALHSGDEIFDDDPSIDSEYDRLYYETTTQIHPPLTDEQVQNAGDKAPETIFVVNISAKVSHSPENVFDLRIPQAVPLVQTEVSEEPSWKSCVFGLSGWYSSNDDRCVVFRSLAAICITVNCTNCGDSQSEMWHVESAFGGVGCLNDGSVSRADIIPSQGLSDDSIPEISFDDVTLTIRSVYDPILVAGSLTDNTRVFGRSKRDALVIGITCMISGALALAATFAQSRQQHGTRVDPVANAQATGLLTGRAQLQRTTSLSAESTTSNQTSVSPGQTRPRYPSTDVMDL